MALSFKYSITFFIFSISLIPSALAGGISEIGMGGSYTAAMGSAYTSLGKAKPLGFDAMGAMDMGFGPSTQLIISGIFQKFDLANMPAPGASIFLLGAFGGLKWITDHSGKDRSSIGMSFAAQLGTAYDWLVFKDATSTTPNAGINFAARFMPGVSYGIGSSLGLGLDFPVAFILLKSPLAIWSATLSLRLKMI